jgi:hypothetical protein
MHQGVPVNNILKKRYQVLAAEFGFGGHSMDLLDYEMNKIHIVNFSYFFPLAF